MNLFAPAHLLILIAGLVFLFYARGRWLIKTLILAGALAIIAMVSSQGPQNQIEPVAAPTPASSPTTMGVPAWENGHRVVYPRVAYVPAEKCGGMSSWDRQFEAGGVPVPCPTPPPGWTGK